ncbi:unnamed protein product [Callosobruchus maculatus]|uniref:Uncharacterized protein n=1 Tax=Callosobruchus maculatus TaxID=64391 RepID=A0A653BIS0_CALMS|nr:unnamed protein product [Callosobruchus maculatus]
MINNHLVIKIKTKMDKREPLNNVSCVSFIPSIYDHNNTPVIIITKTIRCTMLF